MADGKFHFSNGEILMKETFLIFLSGRKDIVHDGKLFWVKKRGKKKCEISLQWHFGILRLVGVGGYLKKPFCGAEEVWIFYATSTDPHESIELCK